MLEINNNTFAVPRKDDEVWSVFKLCNAGTSESHCTNSPMSRGAYDNTAVCPCCTDFPKQIGAFMSQVLATCERWELHHNYKEVGSELIAAATFINSNSDTPQQRAVTAHFFVKVMAFGKSPFNSVPREGLSTRRDVYNVNVTPPTSAGGLLMMMYQLTNRSAWIWSGHVIERDSGKPQEEACFSYFQTARLLRC
jgi:hypothetical protein